jgi:hypothetical protein
MRSGKRQSVAKIRASALARLEALLHLIDDVHLALATDEAVGAMTTAQRFQRVPDFHLNTDGK